jgi:hypothetical protein
MPDMPDRNNYNFSISLLYFYFIIKWITIYLMKKKVFK